MIGSDVWPYLKRSRSHETFKGQSTYSRVRSIAYLCIDELPYNLVQMFSSFKPCAVTLTKIHTSKVTVNSGGYSCPLGCLVLIYFSSIMRSQWNPFPGMNQYWAMRVKLLTHQNKRHFWFGSNCDWLACPDLTWHSHTNHCTRACHH